MDHIDSKKMYEGGEPSSTAEEVFLSLLGEAGDSAFATAFPPMMVREEMIKAEEREMWENENCIEVEAELAAVDGREKVANDVVYLENGIRYLRQSMGDRIIPEAGNFLIVYNRVQNLVEQFVGRRSSVIHHPEHIGVIAVLKVLSDMDAEGYPQEMGLVDILHELDDRLAYAQAALKSGV